MYAQPTSHAEQIKLFEFLLALCERRGWSALAELIFQAYIAEQNKDHHAQV